MKGRLARPIDWLDLLVHGTPWVLLVLKGIISIRNGQDFLVVDFSIDSTRK